MSDSGLPSTLPVLTFTVYGKPEPAGSKVAGRARNGRMFVRDDNTKAAPWKRAIVPAAVEALQGGMFDGPLALELSFVVPRPKGHYGKHGLRPSAPIHPTVRPDVTKLVRAVEDALTGVVWRDDSQVVSQVAVKRYGEPARCEVTVKAIE